MLGVALLVGCSHAAPPWKPTANERVASRLKDVERMELLAIDPFGFRPAAQATTRTDDADRFYNYRVLGRATIIDRVASRRLADSIAVSDPPDGTAKACVFAPHHGVRFTLADGATIDFVICFTCGDARMMTSGRSSDGFWIDRGEAANFNALFRQHGVPVPADD